MDNKYCADCKYYLQHYTFNAKKIFRVHCGHCTLGRSRRKQPDCKACESFSPGSALEDRFVSKEYLSRELLKYVLSLDLLPEIEEGEQDGRNIVG